MIMIMLMLMKMIMMKMMMVMMTLMGVVMMVAISRRDGDDDYGDGVIYTHFVPIRMIHRDSAELVRCLHRENDP